MFCKGVVRTNKLYCSDCKSKIRKGDDVVFELDSKNTMINVFCCNCSDNYLVELENDSIHPFSEDSGW